MAGLLTLAESAAAMDGIRIRGLMAIPPAGCDSALARRYFGQMRELFDKLKAQDLPNVRADILSMGMSGSYVDAILEGANLVRVGTSIYGPRDYRI